MLTKRTHLAAVASLLLVAGMVRAQSPAPQPKTVRVPVTVSGPRKSPALNLKQEDFRILEGGAQRPITEFLAPNQPMEIDVIVAHNLMPNSRATYAEVDIRNAIDKFKTIGNPANRYAVEELSQGTNGLFDAISQHVEKLSRSSNPRRALVVLTGRGLDPAGPGAGRALAEKVRSMHVPIYIRHAAGTCLEEEIVALGNCNESRLVYDQISEFSGGHPVRFVAVAPYENILVELAEELRDQYVLGFEFSGSPDGKWRSLNVQVSATMKAENLKATAVARHFVAKSR